MRQVTFGIITCLALGLSAPACGSDDDKGSGGAGGSAGSSGNGGTGGTGVTCTEGSTNYYESFYAVPACKSFYDCILAAACDEEENPAQCRTTQQEQLKSAYCLPEGTSFSNDQWAQLCNSAREQVAEQYPACAQ
jgi:hypothetical protein